MIKTLNIPSRILHKAVQSFAISQAKKIVNKIIMQVNAEQNPYHIGHESSHKQISNHILHIAINMKYQTRTKKTISNIGL